MESSVLIVAIVILGIIIYYCDRYYEMNVAEAPRLQWVVGTTGQIVPWTPYDVYRDECIFRGRPSHSDNKQAIWDVNERWLKRVIITDEQRTLTFPYMHNACLCYEFVADEALIKFAEFISETPLSYNIKRTGEMVSIYGPYRGFVLALVQAAIEGNPDLFMPIESQMRESSLNSSILESKLLK